MRPVRAAVTGAALLALAVCLVGIATGTPPSRLGSWMSRATGATPQPSVSPVSGARPADAQGPYQVTKVTDGDTIHVSVGGKSTTIRTLGDDTPETHDPRKPVQCYGPEASREAARLLTGKQVWLEYDASQGRTDKYGRALAYVWVGGNIYEMTMLREGYAHEYTYGRAYRRQAQFRAAQAQAKAAQRGFWSPATCGGNTTQPEPVGGFPGR